MPKLQRKFVALLTTLWLLLTCVSFFFALEYFGVNLSSIKNQIPIHIPDLPFKYGSSHGSTRPLPPPPVTQMDVYEVLRNGTNSTLAEKVPEILRAALTANDTFFPRLECNDIDPKRYDYLKHYDDGSEPHKPRYFFTLDLYNAAPILPRLLNSVIEAIRYLGPANCAFSIVEGRSSDGTYEALHMLKPFMARLGVKYHLTTSDLDPSVDAWKHRIQTLAFLRNLALDPLVNAPTGYAPNTTVIFLNDVAACPTDILELIHQRDFQEADMTCGMDWDYHLGHSTFYDVWIARAINGESFFYIPPDGSWDNGADIFQKDEQSRIRFNDGKPLQAFACWNGGVAFAADIFTKAGIRFRAENGKECHTGEPNLFCKDMWFSNYSRIAVIPSVNFAYTDAEGTRLKKERGTVEKWAKKELDNEKKVPLKIAWQTEPPAEVKCIENWKKQFWRPWDHGLRNATNATMEAPQRRDSVTEDWQFIRRNHI